MKPIAISEKISYIPCSNDPLSADIGIIREGEETWLYDVGADERAIAGLTGSYSIVLSHFHQDHTGNLERLNPKALYVSGETKRHVGMGTVVERDIQIGGLHIFPLPSSHCKGCLGLEGGRALCLRGGRAVQQIQGRLLHLQRPAGERGDRRLEKAERAGSAGQPF